VRATFSDEVKVRAAPVSGFFLMRDLFTAYGKAVYELHNASVDASCAGSTSEAWRCFFANESFAFMDTPTFVLNSAVDSYQMGAVPGRVGSLSTRVEEVCRCWAWTRDARATPPPRAQGPTSTIAPMRSWRPSRISRPSSWKTCRVTRMVGRATGASSRCRAAWKPLDARRGSAIEQYCETQSCLEHCAAQGYRANNIKIDNVSMMGALAAWYDAPSSSAAAWHLPCTIHGASPGECNPSCEDK